MITRPSCGNATWGTTDGRPSQFVTMTMEPSNYSLYLIGGQQLCNGYFLLQPDGGHVDCIGNCATGRGYCVAEGSRCLNCVLWEPNPAAGEFLCSAYGTPQGGALPGTAEWDSSPCSQLPPPPTPEVPPLIPSPSPSPPPALECSHSPGWEYAFELIDDPLTNDVPDDLDVRHISRSHSNHIAIT